MSTCAAVLCLLAGSVCAQDADIYVSPNGSDAWSGRVAEPNAQGNDGPFGTVARAQHAARDLREAGREGVVQVALRGGMYCLDEPLEFIPDDSHTAYRAYPGERPIVSAGRAVGDWDIGDDGRWRTYLEDVESGDWRFSQLFVNGGRRLRARLPKQGYYYIAGEVSPTEASQGKGYDRFRFQPGDMRGDWTNVEDIEVLPFHIWAMSRLPVAAIDEELSVVTCSGRTSHLTYWAKIPTGNRYLVENVPEALTEPGEWYLDRGTGILTYIPMPGETPDNTTAIAPRLPAIVRLRGDIDAGLPIEGLTFEDITFAHAAWNMPATGQSVPQADANLPGAISLVAARGVTFEGCAVRHVGAYGMEFGDGCRDCRVVDSAITDLGAGGIKVGSQGYTEDEARICSGITIENCVIAHGGRTQPAGIGVLIMHSPDNVVSHNDIHDFYYSAISVGWQWSYAPSHAHHNTIEQNHVYDIGQGVLSDMGGTYTLGPAEGTVIRNNVYHDIESYGYGGRGIYFDQATTGIVAENNLVYRAKVGAFCMHFGKDNRVVNNIFALGQGGMIEPVRAEEHNQFDFERNIVYWREGPLMITNASGSCYKMKGNLYWNAAGREVTFGGKALDEWQAGGQDEGSLIEDPLFVDPDNGDFTLKPGSPAGKIGFQPFDTSDVGCSDDVRALVDHAAVPRTFPPPPPEPPAIPLIEDFELTDVGEKASGFTTYEDAEVLEATARVTDETAASGAQSLRLTDLPGQKNSWDPHIFYTANFRQGMVTGSFDLRVERGIGFFHEWRTPGNPYIAGPTLRIGGDGMLRAKDTDLTLIPFGEWAHIAITCGVGDSATGDYTVTVTLPGEDPITFEGLKCSPDFDRLSWFGFVCEGTAPGIFYLDNIRLGESKEE